MPLVDHLTADILALVRDRQLLPGDRLPAERRLAQELGASRSSVREAIRVLAHQGVLRTRRGGGTYVDGNEPTPDNCAHHKLFATLDPLVSGDPAYRYDVLETRHALEAGTVWHAALRATDDDKARIRQCFDDIAYYRGRGESAQTARADASFHLAIAEASHNAVMLQTMQGMFELLEATVTENRQRMYVLPSTQEQLTAQHETLMEAIFRGDAEAAREAVCSHLEYVHARVRELDEGEARRMRASRLTHHSTYSQS